MNSAYVTVRRCRSWAKQASLSFLILCEVKPLPAESEQCISPETPRILQMLAMISTARALGDAHRGKSVPTPARWGESSRGGLQPQFLPPGAAHSDSRNSSH